MCDVCDVAHANPFALKRHLNSDAHALQLAVVQGVAAKPEPSSATLVSRRYAARNKAAKKFYCSACDSAFAQQAHLNTHYLSKKHSNNMALPKKDVVEVDADLDVDADVDVDQDSDLDDAGQDYDSDSDLDADTASNSDF